MPRRIISFVALFFYSSVLVLLLFVQWHLKNDDLTVLWGALLLCGCLFGYLLEQKKFILFTALAWISIFSYFSYNPYTGNLLRKMVITQEMEVSGRGIFLVEMPNGQVVSVIKEKAQWHCLGKEFSGRVYCSEIINFVRAGKKQNSDVDG